MKHWLLIFSVLLSGCDRLVPPTDEQRAELSAKTIHEQIGRYQAIAGPSDQIPLVLDTVNGCIFAIESSKSAQGITTISKIRWSNPDDMVRCNGERPAYYRQSKNDGPAFKVVAVRPSSEASDKGAKVIRYDAKGNRIPDSAEPPIPPAVQAALDKYGVKSNSSVTSPNQTIIRYVRDKDGKLVREQ